MTALNKHDLRGQSVEGSYYLAECGHCGEMYPSNKLDGGESLFSGDYGECFCHLCGADDSDIADNGAWGSEAVTAWNYQQKRIEALLDENYRLTAERDALRENIGGDNTRAAADIYFQLVEECEIPAGGSLVEYVDDMREKLEAAEALNKHLELAILKAEGCSEALRRKTEASEKRIAELEVLAFNPALLDVISERQRQRAVEGWTSEHDDAYQNSELADAAACYAINAHNQGLSTPAHWPWAPDWWKQSGPRRDLVKAGALILAEIERIDRAAAGKGETS
jgi:hypothetical protein